MATHPPTVHDSALTDSPLTPLKSQALSYIRELGIKPEHTKTALIGASVAAALAIAVVAVRAGRRRRQPVDDGNGVLGTVVKSVLFAALRTVVKVKLTQLAAKALPHETQRAPAEAISP